MQEQLSQLITSYEELITPLLKGMQKKKVMMNTKVKKIMTSTKGKKITMSMRMSMDTVKKDQQLSQMILMSSERFLIFQLQT